MPYTNKIKTLEDSYRILDNKIFALEKNGSKDIEELKTLQEAKSKCLDELRQLRRLQWDHDHERVNFDDDR